MIWPPIKAWTSKNSINGQRNFVAINYGGELSERWVILISVLDGTVVVKVSWLNLIDESKWIKGWEEDSFSGFSSLDYSQNEINFSSCTYTSEDSGLTIPISEDNIRPWLENN
tara:strand:+ start:662 stop:1000 length:339 start_codon:yes stop_codon:yes gene_type:complete